VVAALNASESYIYAEPNIGWHSTSNAVVDLTPPLGYQSFGRALVAGEASDCSWVWRIEHPRSGYGTSVCEIEGRRIQAFAFLSGQRVPSRFIVSRSAIPLATRFTVPANYIVARDQFG